MMRGVLIRGIFLLIVVGLLVAAVVWWRSRPQDVPLLDIPAVDSKGYVSALMDVDGAQKLASISPSGDVRTTGGDGNIEDADAVWLPNGRRIVIVSNRSSDGSPQLFEWKPDRDNDPFPLTATGATRQRPWFAYGGDEILFASRGDIYAITYPGRKTRRVMPPSQEKETSSEEGEILTPAEGHVHDAIAEAWTKVTNAIEGEGLQWGAISEDKRYFIGICAVARGQALIVQDLEATDEQGIVAKVPLAGDQIQVSVDARTASAVVSVVNFRYPVLSAVPKDKIAKDGTVKRDFVNAVFKVDMKTGDLTPIFLSPDGLQIADSPALSPDGVEVALVVRTKDGKPTDLLISQASEGGISTARAIARGEVAQPAWGPTGETLLFVRAKAIWSVARDGTQEKNLTEGKGSFSSPSFSPMR